MAENVVIYAGLKKVGERKKRALEREALRETKTGSVSELVWSMFKQFGSDKLKRDLEAAEAGAAK